MADAWLDRALPAEDRQGIDEHLASCDVCRTAIDALRCAQHTQPAPFAQMPLLMKQRLLDELRTLRDRGA